jgi:hypothetical protein
MANELISQEELVQQWLAITVDRFKKSIVKERIRNYSGSESLINSFITQLKTAGGGSAAAALIKFKAAGRYVDMGVGRGVPIGSQKAKADFLKYRNRKGQLHRYSRKAKKWYGKTLASETMRLGELMAEHFGINAVQLIESALKNEITISIDGKA